MTDREHFGPYRVAGRNLVVGGGLLALGTVAPAVALLADGGLRSGWRVLLALLLLAGAGLLGWAFASRTTVDADGLEIRRLWMRRRLRWAEIQEITLEHRPELEAFAPGPIGSAHVYDAAGRRHVLPGLEPVQLAARGIDADGEVAALRAAWLRRRGPDWAPSPAALAHLGDRARHGDPILNGLYALCLSALAATVLFLPALFLDAPDWVFRTLWTAPIIAASTWTGHGIGRRRQRIAAAVAAPPDGPAAPPALRVPGDGEIVLGAAVAPDGQRVAVASMPDVSEDNVVREYVSGALARTWSVPGPWVTDLLHLGDAIVLRVEQFMGGTKLYRLTDRGVEEIGGELHAGRLRHGPDGGFLGASGRNLLCRNGTELARTPDGTDAFTYSCDPATGLVALGGSELVVLDVRSGAVVARAAPPGRGPVGATLFAGPGRIVTQLGRPDRDGFVDRLASWRLHGGALTPEATATVATWGRAWPAAIPALGVVVTAAFGPVPSDGGRPVFLDAATLTPVPAPTPSLSRLDGVTAVPESPHGALIPVIRHDDLAEFHAASPVEPGNYRIDGTAG